MTADGFAEVVNSLVAGGIGKRPLHCIDAFSDGRSVAQPDLAREAP